MIRVQTASRLHFGLLSLDTACVMWPDSDGQMSVPARSFGGVGMMVDMPCLEVQIKESDRWSASGSLADRAMTAAQRLAQAVHQQNPNRHLPACHISTLGPTEHVGLGVGTQLAMAVAAGLNQRWELGWNHQALAQAVGRGRRSALGVHGFERGGFLLEAGKRSSHDLSPLALRLDFPSSWPVLLMIPVKKQGKHGVPEEQVFEAKNLAPSQTADLCRLVLLGMVPAIQTLDYSAFSESLFDYNRRAGIPFHGIQGGVYSSPEVTSLIDWLRQQGIQGVGQTSWGPTVFAILPDLDRAEYLRKKVASCYDEMQTIISFARNRGATLETGLES